MGFVHLHVHSEYSLCDSSIRIDALIDKVKAMGHKAVALTDHGNLHAVLDFYEKAREEGIKPIIGCEIYHRGIFPADKPFHLVLLAKNNKGYRNLIEISSLGYIDSDACVPIVSEATLDKHCKDLIALSSCQFGEFAKLAQALNLQSNNDAVAVSRVINTERYKQLQTHVERMQERFGADNYFIELIDNGLVEQQTLLPMLKATAEHFSLPLVCSADAHYLEKDFRSTHDVYLAIMNDLTLTDISARDRDACFHLFADEEIRERYGAYPDAIANTCKIADRCNVDLRFGKYHLPVLAGEPNKDLCAKAEEGLQRRFAKARETGAIDAKRWDEYKERLQNELRVIISMNFAGYFLIVYDFVAWAHAQHIPVGVGRGSGAGSLVAYALSITDIDPLEHQLIFERFLNPERVSMPDFDIDFCVERRDEVIRYVTEKYGNRCVAQITTFGKMNAKSVIRDVGRVLGMNYKKVDMLAKLIPSELEITISSAKKREPRITEEISKDEEYQELIRLCRKVRRFVAQHLCARGGGDDFRQSNYQLRPCL